MPAMIQANPNVAILGIGTAVPIYRMDQEDTSRRLAEALGENSDAARWTRRIFRQCGVETRYTCEPNLLEPAFRCRYFPSPSMEGVPTTAERMETYKRESVPLALQAAGQALSDGKARASDITHLIVVSCTGQFLPGLDAVLVRRLGLAADVNRIPLHFLGCAAGLKAICLSRQIVSGDPDAKVLVVCVELCTIHLRPSGEREVLYAASFFGDGASACIVGSAGPDDAGVLLLDRQLSVLLPDGAEEMVWEVGNHGFDLYLSPDIPKRIGARVPAEIERLLGGGAKPDLWAIHPGGRGIVDALQRELGLTAEQTRFSRSVLRRYGNLSSATILFVLDEMRRELAATGSGPASGLSLAFGPGLSAEMIRFDYLPSAIRQEEPAGGAVV